MNTQPATSAFASKLAPINAEQWSAYRLGERESDALPLTAPLSPDDAVGQAIASHRLNPGDTLAVLYQHAGRGKQTLWVYAIRKSTKRYTWREALDGGRPVKVHALDAKLICETAVSAFAPVLRFDAFRDDAVGADPQLVEQRS